ncbi:MAG TPA: hypothetical protein VFA97_00495 [Gaiellaceae bacterium]|nr:hypothetical protein [Gaiellaceae bacterium]
MSTVDAEAGLRDLAPSGRERLRALLDSTYLRGLAFVLTLSWLGRAAWIHEFPKAASTDAASWAVVVHQLQHGHNPYVTTNLLGWGPLWLIVLYALDHTAGVLGVSFLLALRLLLIGIESLLIAAIYACIHRLTGDLRLARSTVLFGISLNPIAILMVCQHCNFDVLVALFMFWGALEVMAYAKARDVTILLSASLAFGLGALAKTVPIALAPLLADGVRRETRRAQVVALVALLAPLGLGLAVLFALAPSAVTHHVLLYHSTSDVFGVSGLLTLGGLHGLAGAWTHAGTLLMLAWIVIGWWMLRRTPLDPARTLLLTGLVMLAIPTFGPGYATQYVYWWMPFLVATYPLFDRTWRRLLLALYGVACATYLFDYAIEPTYGGFLDRTYVATHALLELGATLQSPGWQTVVRTPYFLLCVVVFAAGVRRMRA